MKAQIYYWDLANNCEISIDEIRNRMPNASIPDGCDMSGLGYFSIITQELPPYDPLTQELQYTVTPTMVRGVPIYSKTWQVVSLPEAVLLVNQQTRINKIKTSIETAVQLRLDSFARSKGYDGILSACSYANSTNPVFKAESDRCILLRDQTWMQCSLIMNEVIAGTRQLPNSYDEIANELPPLTWE